MSEIVVQQAATALTETGAQPGTSSPRQVDAQEQSQFAEQLNQPTTETMTEPVTMPDVSQNAGTGNVTKTPGDTILDNLSHQMSETRTVVEGQLNAISGEMGELMRLQYDIARVTMDQTMIGQVGSKGSQGIQQLLKGQ